MKLVVRGFTLIELVVVLVLVGITGAVVTSRFLSPSAFNVVAVRDGLITTLRSAQQAALGRSAVRFRIEEDGDELVFTVLAGSTDEEIRRLEVPSANVTLETGATGWTANTCAAVATFADPLVDFELAFDNRGNLASVANDGPAVPVDANFNGVRLCVNDTVEMSVCVSPAGYAYAGSCDR